MLLTVLILWFVITGVVIVFYARKDLVDTWREPVLRRPVMIIESDDWGAGPAEQAVVLKDIKKLLESITDADGRHPVMTLGVILATADGKHIGGSHDYIRHVISRDSHADLLDVINSGVEAGVFTVQLHGMEHFWPAALLTAAETDPIVCDWLQQSPENFTEMLPAALQSRWVDVSVLPSKPLLADDIRFAVAEEVKAFSDIFGVEPEVVVPPTFIWNADVECAWADAGVGVIVTPGRHIESRDANGRPIATGRPIYNSQAGLQNIIYMVRDVYFEPILGHTAERALVESALRTRVKRPVLFETHRFNFSGAQADPVMALKELESLLQGAVNNFPEVAFVSTGKLANLLKSGSPEWVEQRLLKRVPVWIERLGLKSRLHKMVAMSGWIIPVWLIWRICR